MASPLDPSGFMDIFSGGSDILPMINIYMGKLSSMNQLEVIGLITVGLALSQIILCATLAMDTHAISKRSDIR